MQFSVLTKWVLFVALDSKSKIPKSPTQKLNRLLKVAFYHATEVCLWWVRIEFSPSHRPFPTHHCWRIEDVSLSSQIGCYLMLSPHWGSKNLFAVSSFNKSQQTGRKQIYSVRCFLWYGRKKKKNSPWQKLDMEIFKQRRVLSLEKMGRNSFPRDLGILRNIMFLCLWFKAALDFELFEKEVISLL